MTEQPLKPESGDTGFTLSGVLVAAQFLTTMPPLLKRPFTSRELGQAVALFPVVGLLLGAVLVGVNLLLAMFFPTAVRAALLLVTWVLLTGVLHLDGFLDACDGLFGGFTPEKRLEIMRDERVGAFALAGGVLLLLVQFTALTAVPHLNLALLLAPTLGRWAMTLAIVGFPYARPSGLGRTMKDEAGLAEVLLATAVALIVVVMAGGIWGLGAMGLVALLVWLGSRFVLRRIPGLTGDIYGALCVLSETAVLLLLVISGKF
ncbi:MAG: adenosylcobinamide-GDP ribazoletransferase [Anaerolineales bacterium]|nr:adenosylcobinamide-GDP ribazoletransferase [Anaerolineales bacterium]